MQEPDLNQGLKTNILTLFTRKEVLVR